MSAIHVAIEQLEQDYKALLANPLYSGMLAESKNRARVCKDNCSKIKATDVEIRINQGQAFTYDEFPSLAHHVYAVKLAMLRKELGEEIKTDAQSKNYGSTRPGISGRPSGL